MINGGGSTTVRRDADENHEVRPVPEVLETNQSVRINLSLVCICIVYVVVDIYFLFV